MTKPESLARVRRLERDALDLSERVKRHFLVVDGAPETRALLDALSFLDAAWARLRDARRAGEA